MISNNLISDRFESAEMRGDLLAIAVEANILSAGSLWINKSFCDSVAMFEVMGKIVKLEQ